MWTNQHWHTITFPYPSLLDIYTNQTLSFNREKRRRVERSRAGHHVEKRCKQTISACQGTEDTASRSVSFPSVWACALCCTCVSLHLSYMFVVRCVLCTSEPSRAAGIMLFTVNTFTEKSILPLLNRDTAVIRQCVLCVCWDYEGILLYSVDNRNSQVSKITDIIQNRFSYFHHSTLSKYFPTYPNLKSQSIAKTQNANKISSRKDKKCHT